MAGGFSVQLASKIQESTELFILTRKLPKTSYYPEFFIIKCLGSGALSGLMLDLGLLKISYGDVFSYL